MKIVIVHAHYRQRGGEDSVFETECAMLERAGHSVVRYEKSNADLDETHGRLRLALRAVWNGAVHREFRALLRCERPDVVHVHNTFPSISPSVYWAAAAEGVPVVQTLHNYRLCCLNGYLFRDGAVCERCLGRAPWPGVRRRCCRGSLAQSAVAAATLAVHRALGTYRRKVTRYVALSEDGRKTFVKARLPPGRIVVKPNAWLSSDRNAETAPVRTDRDPGRPMVFLYLGRLSPEKGPALLLEAWRRLWNGPDPPPCGAARLVVAGDGPERSALEQAAAGLPEVSFAGSVPRELVPDLLRSSDALVFPSVWRETFGLAVSEAAFEGVPSIATDIGAPATLVEDGKTGFLFHAGDADSLASALRSAVADPARLAAAGRAARAAFLASDCLPDRNLAALESIYRDVRHRPD